MSNPLMSERLWQERSMSGEVMTAEGTITKTIMLTGLLIAVASVAGVQVNSTGTLFGIEPTIALIGSGIIGFICALVGTFAKSLAAPMSITYAIVKGVFLGLITLMFENMYSGIAMTAVAATLTTFATMLLLYRARIIKVTKMFRTIIVGATLFTRAFRLGYICAVVFWYRRRHDGSIVW